MNDERNFRIDIPAGLTDMLRDFTVAVLQRRPTDLHLFAVSYFGELLQERRRVERPVPMYVIVDEDQEVRYINLKLRQYPTIRANYIESN